MKLVNKMKKATTKNTVQSEQFQNLKSCTDAKSIPLTRITLTNGNALRCFWRISSVFSTSITCRVTLVKNPMLSHKHGKDGIWQLFISKYSIIIPDIKQQRIERPISRVIHGNDGTIFLLSVINGSASS
jgi:hypothetical protein